MNQFIVGTDTASIGIWDIKWSDPSIREKPLSKFLKRLPLDAEKRQLFYIETGGDGQSSAHVYIDEQFTGDDYTLLSDDFFLETTSGRCVIDGLEFYGSPYAESNIFTIAPGSYKVKLYVLKNDELEQSTITREGEEPPKTLIEKIWILGTLALLASIYLLFKGKYPAGGTLFGITAVYSYFLGKAQDARKLHDKRKVTVEVQKPYLVFVLSRDSKNGRGGRVSLAGRLKRTK